jgi:hypothetical protein
MHENMVDHSKAWLVLSFVGTMLFWRASAADPMPADWGPTNCGGIMSLALERPRYEIKTNQPVNLAMCVKNVSNGILYLEDTTEVRDFSFAVISPSNIDISPKHPDDNGLHFRNIIRSIKPGEHITYTYTLSSICSFTQIGTYKVTVKREAFDGCEFKSNELKIVVVPGEWKSDPADTPRKGF